MVGNALIVLSHNDRGVVAVIVNPHYAHNVQHL